MRLTGVIAEDFCNYKLPSMFLSSAFCDWKCCKEQGFDISICQNSGMVNSQVVDFRDSDIYSAFHANNITKAVVIGGLEPFLQFEELESLISMFRERGEDCDFVIYTGYYPEEVSEQIAKLSRYGNIVVKFGRYIPSSTPRYDGVLGVTLASENQFARRLC